nr:CDPK-related kinase 5-like [Ipomoea batatas]
MGVCTSKPSLEPRDWGNDQQTNRNGGTPVPVKDNPDNGENQHRNLKVEGGRKSPFFPFYSPSPAHYLFAKKSPARSPANAPSSNSTPRRFFRRPFPPPSPAKHIRAVLARRHGSVKPNGAAIPEGAESEGGLDKSFGFSKHFSNKYELGEEVGRGHFGYTCRAKFKKGELKGQEVAVKVIPKAKVGHFVLPHSRYLEFVSGF